MDQTTQSGCSVSDSSPERYTHNNWKECASEHLSTTVTNLSKFIVRLPFCSSEREVTKYVSKAQEILHQQKIPTYSQDYMRKSGVLLCLSELALEPLLKEIKTITPLFSAVNMSISVIDDYVKIFISNGALLLDSNVEPGNTLIDQWGRMLAGDDYVTYRRSKTGTEDGSTVIALFKRFPLNLLRIPNGVLFETYRIFANPGRRGRCGICGIRGHSDHQYIATDAKEVEIMQKLAATHWEKFILLPKDINQRVRVELGLEEPNPSPHPVEDKEKPTPVAPNCAIAEERCALNNEDAGTEDWKTASSKIRKRSIRRRKKKNLAKRGKGTDTNSKATPAKKDKKEKETATKTPTKNKINKLQCVKDKESKEDYLEVMEQEEVSSTPSKEIPPGPPPT